MEEHTTPFFSGYSYFLGFTFKQNFYFDLKALPQPTFELSFQFTSQLVLQSLGTSALMTVT